MLQSVKNLSAISADKIILTSSAAKTIIPEINSIVGLQILEKISGGYKVLIDGKLFQANLPFNFQVNELIIARVINKNPFTLQVNNLLTSDLSRAFLANDIISRFNLKNTSDIQKIVNQIIDSNKPLEKSRMEALVRYLDIFDFQYNDLLFALMIQIAWNNYNDLYKEIASWKKSFFNINLEELLTDLAKKILFIRENPKIYPGHFILVENLITDCRNATINYNSNREILYRLLINCGKYDDNFNQEFKTLILKFFIQIAIYNYFGIFPEFGFINKGDNLHIVLYFYYMNNEAEPKPPYLIVEDYINVWGKYKLTAIQNKNEINCILNLGNTVVIDPLILANKLQMKILSQYNIKTNMIIKITEVNSKQIPINMKGIDKKI